jgi:GNAT superfamily N-acetyltransferase
MSIEIREIKPTKRELLKFVHFPIDCLYSDSPYYVPALITDELNTLLPDKNPAFEFCEAVYYMAYKDGKPVGRIAGIINKVVNKRSNKAEVRFGFVDFIDDDEVVDALFDAVTKWGKANGMTTFTGPLGFTDMDREGLLVEGFDRISTQATIYNYQYYQKQIERLGFVKDIDWVEYIIYIPETIPDKMIRVGEIVKARLGLHNIKYTDRKKLVKDYGDPIFRLINESYDKLFGYSPLSESQIKHYIKMYLPFLPLNDLSLIVKDDGTLVGVGIAIPSLAKALIKSRGRLLPMGWYHLVKAFKAHNDVVDLLLIGIQPEYQSKGANALIFNDLIPCFRANGYKWAESNPELEVNDKVQKQWHYFETEQHKRRRAYTKDI